MSSDASRVLATAAAAFRSHQREVERSRAGDSPSPDALIADAASLRLAFTRAAESFPAGFVMPDPVREWWARFYAAIRDHEAGLALLGELARLREEVDRVAKP